MDDRGVVEFRDERLVARASVQMHSVGWKSASIRSRDVAVQRAGDRVRGSIPLPANCTGSLDYTVSLTPQAGAADVAYSMSFTDPNEVFGAYVSFLIPADRFEGKRIALRHGGSSIVLPLGKAPSRLDGAAAGVEVDMGEGQSLVIAGNAVGHVLVQNNRAYGANEFELRFHLFGRGRVHPAMVARRRFRVAVVPSGQAEALAQAVCPARTIDLSRPFAMLGPKGEVAVRRGSERLVNARLAIHGVGWAYTSQGSAKVQASGDDRTRCFTGVLAVPATEDGEMEFVEVASARDDGALDLKYWLHFPRGVTLNGYQVSFDVPVERCAGTAVDLDTGEGPKRVAIPDALGEKFLFRGKITGLALAPDSDEGFSLAADQPSDLLIQDNRGWGGSTLEFRFNFRRQEEGEPVPAGETVERTFTFRLNGPMQFLLDEGSSVSQTDTAGWIPFTLPWDAAPVDVSFLNHRPAGKFGFVTVRDGQFVLSDTGQPIRFWGTCFSAGANFPTHDQAEKIAKRLAKFGVNIVRTHHADAKWAGLHFFKPDADNTRTFDSEGLDRFDYMIYCLKREGIYIYLDQLVNRYFKPGDGVDAVAQLGACAKPYSNFDPRLIELQKEFSRKLWTHVNPYTGAAYKDEPAIALMEFANENDLFTQEVELEPYRTRLEAMYRSWAERERVELPGGKINFRARTDPMIRFFVHVQRAFYRDMERYLRDEVGVRVPMTGSNWSRSAALLTALSDCAYTDSHAYWNHPSKEGMFGNRPMVAAGRTIFDTLGFQRLAGKPFFVSEWDEPWPNEWRAELPVWMAAAAAFQGWNGLTVYTYRHRCTLPVDSLSGAFETFNDPARFGLFPHAALVFRRGDVAVGRERVAVHIPPDLAVSAKSPTPWSAPAYSGLAEVRRFNTVLAPQARGYASVLEVDSDSPAADDVRVTDTGQMWRSARQRVGRIDAPRTQAVFGFLADAGEQTTTDLRVACETSFATVALSSLTDDPIARSDRLLLTAVGRAENTGFKYSVLRNRRVASGRGPILIDPVRARVSIRVVGPGLRVWALSPGGERLGQVQSTHNAGRLAFAIGPDAKTMCYQVER